MIKYNFYDFDIAMPLHLFYKADSANEPIRNV